MNVIVHRGLTTASPENSLGAIEAAIAAGFEAIEVDVRASADGVPFLLHDPTLDRTTNASGRLRGMTTDRASLARLSDGSPLPRLEEALDLARGRARLCLDTKDAGLASTLKRALQAREGDVEVWSSHPPLVAALSEAGIRTALISNGLLPRGVGEFLWRARATGANAVSFYPADIEAHVAAACRNAGLDLISGTPNDEPTWRYLANAGAVAIVTDRPVECRAALGGVRIGRR